MKSYRRHAALIVSAVFVFGACSPVHMLTPAPSDATASPDRTTVPAVPIGTPSPSVSPLDLATRTAFSARVATLDALYATEMALLPECGGSSDHSESPDGRWKTLQCFTYGMVVYNLTNYSKAWYFSYYDLYGAPYEHGNRFGHIYPIHWSADGKFLYFVAYWSGDGGCAMYYDGSALFRLDLSSGEYTMLVPPDARRLYGSFSFSNGDTTLAHIALSPEQHAVLTLLDLRSNLRTDIPLGDRYAEGGYLIWSPDNRQVLFSARSSGECETMTYYLVWMDLKQRTQRIFWQGKSAEILPVSWHNGDQVIVQAFMQATGSGGLFSVSLSSGEMKPYSGPALRPVP